MWCYRFIKRNGISIRRISHIGQIPPANINKYKASFIEEVINKRRIMNISVDDNYTTINMDETAFYLEMGFNTTLEFKGKRNVEIISSGREHYRISVLLAITANGLKLPPFIIIKGEGGKTIEKELRNLPYVRNGNLFVYCQPQGWCTSYLFIEWIKAVFLPYEKEYGEKCLLIMDKASSHISKDSLSILEEKKINYVLIPGGLTSECQPLDISVNKIFKDNLKLRFEKERLLYDILNNKIKLKSLRINLLDYINQVWYDNTIITKNIIEKGFEKAGIIKIFI